MENARLCSHLRKSVESTTSEPPKTIASSIAVEGSVFNGDRHAQFIQMILCDGKFEGHEILSNRRCRQCLQTTWGIYVTPVTSIDHNLSADFEFMRGVPKSGTTFQINEDSVIGGPQRRIAQLGWALQHPLLD